MSSSLPHNPRPSFQSNRRLSHNLTPSSTFFANSNSPRLPKSGNEFFGILEALHSHKFHYTCLYPFSKSHSIQSAIWTHSDFTQINVKMPKGQKTIDWTPANDARLLLTIVAVENLHPNHEKVATAFGKFSPSGAHSDDTSHPRPSQLMTLAVINLMHSHKRKRPVLTDTTV